MKKYIANAKFAYLLIVVGTIAALFILPNVMMYGIYMVFIHLLHISAAQFAKYAYLVETLVSLTLIIFFFAVYTIIFKKRKSEKAQTCGMKAAIMSVLAGTGIYGVSFLWIQSAERIPALSASLSAMDRANAEIGGGNALGVVLTAVVVAPLWEELVFRGIIFNSLRNIKQGWVPILLSAVIFGVYHMNLVQAVYAMFMGVVAAIVYADTRDLRYPILIHMTNNLVGAIQSFSLQDRSPQFQMCLRLPWSSRYVVSSVRCLSVQTKET